MSDRADLALEKLSHDLRTPLTALKMAVTLLVARRKAGADPDEIALLNALQRNVARMEEMVVGLSTERARSANAADQ